MPKEPNVQEKEGLIHLKFSFCLPAFAALVVLVVSLTCFAYFYGIKKKFMPSALLKRKFNDNVLLQIHRDYSLNESVLFLEKELKEARFQIGVLKSHNSELQSELFKVTKKFEKIKEILK